MRPSPPRKLTQNAKNAILGPPEIHAKSRANGCKIQRPEALLSKSEPIQGVSAVGGSIRPIVCDNTHMILCYTHLTTHVILLSTAPMSQPAYAHKCVLHWPENQCKLLKKPSIWGPQKYTQNHDKNGLKCGKMPCTDLSTAALLGNRSIRHTLC